MIKGGDSNMLSIGIEIRLVTCKLMSTALVFPTAQNSTRYDSRFSP